METVAQRVYYMQQTLHVIILNPSLIKPFMDVYKRFYDCYGTNYIQFDLKIEKAIRPNAEGEKGVKG